MKVCKYVDTDECDGCEEGNHAVEDRAVLGECVHFKHNIFYCRFYNDSLAKRYGKR